MKIETLCFALLFGLLQNPVMADDHPELTPADEAYSAEKYDEAARLYRRDAELGVIAAQVNLAILYLDGLGVGRDDKQAAVWFLRAAEQGNQEAQHNLGLLYQEGRGVAQNAVEADKWFNIAGSTSQSEAIERKMNQEQIAEAKKLASEWISSFNQKRSSR
ncbi:MAG: tetratricopeptide repeat protein [Methylococcaceae bacterium]|nr:tetratricopeptide repeat protein [Methylococcaceae bacterium]